MKKAFLLTMIASLLISFVFSTPVYSEQHEEQSQEEQQYEETEIDIHDKMRQVMQEQEGAVAANEVLMEYFCQGEIEPIYPEYFSGRYIENNKLYVCYVGSLEKVQEELDQVFGDLVSYVEYKGCNYSYRELEEYLSTALVNIKARGCNVTGYGISEKENHVTIYVDEATTLKTKDILFNSNRTSDERVSVKTRGYIYPTTNVYGGVDISIPTEYGNIYATLGICGTYNGQPAFVTCGHYMMQGDTVRYNGTTLGVIQKVQFANEQDGDFSIGTISNTSVFSVTHKVKSGVASYTTLTGGTLNYPAVGTVVSRYGSITNLTYGTIVDILAAGGYFTSVTVTDLIEVEPYDGDESESGDSGGPIWSNGKFLGILSGKHYETEHWYFTSYRHIQAAGFTAYASHQISSWTNYSSSQHRGYCSMCQAYVLELHAAYLNSSGVCTRCGYSGNSVAQ